METAAASLYLGSVRPVSEHPVTTQSPPAPTLSTSSCTFHQTLGIISRVPDRKVLWFPSLVSRVSLSCHDQTSVCRISASVGLIAGWRVINNWLRQVSACSSGRAFL